MERYDRVGISWRAGEKESDAWKGVCAAGLSGLKGGCLWSGKTLLSEKRMRGSERNRMRKKSDFRSEFEKDYHRIIGKCVISETAG